MRRRRLLVACELRLVVRELLPARASPRSRACERFWAFCAFVSESDTVAVCTLCAAAASETASCAFSCAFNGLSVCCRRPFAVARPASRLLHGLARRERVHAGQHLALGHVLALLDEQRGQRPARLEVGRHVAGRGHAAAGRDRGRHDPALHGCRAGGCARRTGRAESRVGIDPEREEREDEHPVHDPRAGAQAEPSRTSGGPKRLRGDRGPLVRRRGAHEKHFLPHVCECPGIGLRTSHESRRGDRRRVGYRPWRRTRCW